MGLPVPWTVGPASSLGFAPTTPFSTHRRVIPHSSRFLVHPLLRSLAKTTDVFPIIYFLVLWAFTLTSILTKVRGQAPELSPPFR